MPSQLTVRLPDDLDRVLKAATRRMQHGSSDIVRLALRAFLGDRASYLGARSIASEA